MCPVRLTGANEGRAFFSCPKLSKAGQCKFFKWADELEGGGGVAVAGNASGSGSKGGSGSCFVCGEGEDLLAISRGRSLIADG